MVKKTKKEIFTYARKLAMDALHKCTAEGGFVAGEHHFVDYWARDVLFATLGATGDGFDEITKKTIDTFISFQRKDGLIPYRVMRSKTNWAKYRGRPSYLSTPIPNFRTPQSGGLVPDGGLLTVIAAYQYFQNTKDIKTLRRWYPYLENAMRWYFQRNKNLIFEWFLCEWADAVLKIGNTLYTNILYWKALNDMSDISNVLKKDKKSENFKARKKQILEAINKKLWNGTYFADWRDYKRQDYFSSHANMLCIIFGLTTSKQSKLILEFAEKNCWASWTMETNYPKYPFWRIPLGNYLLGMGDYHNRGCLWLQSGILYSLALQKVLKASKAKGALLRIAEKIVKYNGVFEVYEKNGRPVRRWSYLSENPFAWSAGLFLWANNAIKP